MSHAHRTLDTDWDQCRRIKRWTKGNFQTDKTNSTYRCFIFFKWSPRYFFKACNWFLCLMLCCIVRFLKSPFSFYFRTKRFQRKYLFISQWIYLYQTNRTEWIREKKTERKELVVLGYSKTLNRLTLNWNICITMAAKKFDSLRFSQLFNYEIVSQNLHIYTKQGNGIYINEHNQMK